MKKKLRNLLILLIALFCLFTSAYFLRIDRYGMSKISWVDTVKVGGRKYFSDFSRLSIDGSLVGEQIGVIKFNVSRNVNNPRYVFRNGDATFLEVGTKLYRIKGLGSDNQIAVLVDGQYILYFAKYNN